MFLIILTSMIACYCLEKWFIPGRKLYHVENWITRAVILNLSQLAIVMIGYYTWEKILIGNSVFAIGSKNYSTLTQGIIGYLINTWIFYWWHRLRHETEFFWLWCHQLHHSPTRMETITAFYKHPLEILLNSVIITILVYPILGLSIEANGWISLFSALTEFFYHMNIKTPYWIGYFIQRPEAHRFHHKFNCIKTFNYADLPIWDILGGTFYNPESDVDCEIGFTRNREQKFNEMLCGKNVLEKKITIRKTGLTVFIILAISCSGIIGLAINNQTLRSVAFMSAASPVPLVFSAFNGIETFSTSFNILIETDDRIHSFALDNKLYNKISGPYNLRNVYGVMFSHGPFFNTNDMIKLRQRVLEYGICNTGQLAKNFGFYNKINRAKIIIKSNTKGNEKREWVININC